MAIDNTYTFGLNESQIISLAMQLIGALGEDESPSANAYSICQTMLNAMLKSWDAYDLHQWKMTDCTLLLTQNTSVYTLGPQSTSANASETVVYTTVNSAISANVSNVVITVASSTGISANDVIALVQDDGSILYGTVTSIASNNITTNITTTKTSQVGNAVFDYTSRMQKPLDIFDVRRLDTSNTEIPLTKMTSREYFELTNKQTTGIPVSYFFQSLVSTGLFYTWPPSNDMTLRIKFRYEKQLSDLLVATDNPDLPQEFYSAIIYNLGVIIAPFFGRLNELDKITPIATSLLNTVIGFDQEHTSIQLTPSPY